MSVLFLDIETTGLSRAYDEITTIVWHYEDEWGHWVSGRDDTPSFVPDWGNIDHLVTYNGKCFDEPFLCRTFGVPKHHSHVDLRYLLARQGIKGGLKAIAAAQSLNLSAEIQDVDGFVAFDLWAEYQSGSPEALDCLLYYNAWDVNLLIQLYNRFVSDGVRETFPALALNPHWLEDFLMRRNEQYSQPQGNGWGWIPKEPRSAQDLTLEIVDDLKDQQGITPAMPWFGNVISFTGQMENRDGTKLKREDARQIANSVGFVWIDAPRVGCTHLVASSSLGHETTKAKRARELGITISTPKDFWEFVDLG